MKKNRDPRITAKRFSALRYIFLFLFLLFACGSYTGLYFLQIDMGSTDATYITLSMVTYLVVLSAFVTFVVMCFRNHHLRRPIIMLSEAARKVAQGDYTVQLAPMRTDGKKDEFEVLFEDFNTMVAELNSTELLKKDFISNVSHELKTPLSVMQNFATILQSDNLSDSEKKEYAHKIAEASKRLSILVTNILQVNRLENQKIVANRAPFNLSEQISRCAVGYEQIWVEKDIELCADLDQNIIITSDEGLLDIVWNNLISNALKFTPQGGTVHIRAMRKDDTALVVVEDTGCGIEAEALTHIFDKFYQADTSHSTQGNGLGLALVKQILQLLAGTISVSSTPGQGSVFTVSLKIE